MAEPPFVEAPRQDRILDILRRAAEAGIRCPTNQDIAAQIGTGTTLVVEAIQALERQGLIAVKRFQSSRVVTIRLTGARTADPKVVKAPHRRRGARR